MFASLVFDFVSICCCHCLRRLLYCQPSYTPVPWLETVRPGCDLNKTRHIAALRLTTLNQTSNWKPTKCCPSRLCRRPYHPQTISSHTRSAEAIHSMDDLGHTIFSGKPAWFDCWWFGCSCCCIYIQTYWHCAAIIVNPPPIMSICSACFYCAKKRMFDFFSSHFADSFHSSCFFHSPSNNRNSIHRAPHHAAHLTITMYISILMLNNAILFGFCKNNGNFS